jgi:hypothetical protein
MSALDRLVDEHLRELSGAEFKVAAYLYRRLARRQEVEMTIGELGSAAGASPKQTYTVLLRLRSNGLLRLITRRGCPTRFSLPAVSPPPVPVVAPSAVPAPAPPLRQSPVLPAPQPPQMQQPAAKPVRPIGKANQALPAQTVNAKNKTPATMPISVGNQRTTAPGFAEPPTPAVSEEEQCRQLASELVNGLPIDRQGMVELNAAMEGQSAKSGALLRRLLELKRRGKTARNVHELAAGVRGFYWL